eukprot:g1392.t1
MSAPRSYVPPKGLGLAHKDIHVGMDVITLRNELEVQKAFATIRHAAYDPAIQSYIGQRGVVLRKDCSRMVQVEMKDHNKIWFPSCALRSSKLKKGRLTPYHAHALAESDLELSEVGEWACSRCRKNSVRDAPLGKPWICLGGTSFRLCRTCVMTSKEDGNASLWLAATNGNRSQMKELIRTGHSVNQKRDETTWTPLHCAAKAGHPACLEILLENGADTNFKDVDGRTPLHLAAFHHNVECVELLLQYGAIPKLTNKNGKTAAHKAMEVGNEVILTMLMDASRGGKQSSRHHRAYDEISDDGNMSDDSGRDHRARGGLERRSLSVFGGGADRNYL